MLLSVLHFGHLGLLVMLSLNTAVDSRISKFRKSLIICPDWQEKLGDLYIGVLLHLEGFWLFGGFLHTLFHLSPITTMTRRQITDSSLEQEPGVHKAQIREFQSCSHMQVMQGDFKMFTFPDLASALRTLGLKPRNLYMKIFPR